jgi:DNA end-binding protein Ku
MARSTWNGTLGFGLVSIGVELHPVEAANALDLDLLDRRDLAPVGYRKYNKRTGAEVASEDVVRGYAVDEGRHVVLTDDDLRAANPRATGTIDVLGFVTDDAIDRVYFETPYFVVPQRGSEKAHALFTRALEHTGRVGIAQIVLRTKQHVVAIYPYRGALVAHTLRYHEELRQPAEAGLAVDAEAAQGIRPQELSMARQLVENMAVAWRPEEFRDRYRDDLLRLVRARSGDAPAPAPEPTPPAEEARVLDLVAALQRSLDARAQGRTARGA